MHAVSLNYRDKAIIDGTYPIPLTFPMIPTSDLAGEVVAVGADVNRLRPGDNVVSVYKPFWLDGVPSQEANAANLGGPLPGTLAEYVVLREDGALPYPAYLTPKEASTLPIAAVTAWVGLFANGKLRPDQTVLVQGSGGVALAALQLAATHGARVIALTRSADKAIRLKELGASDVIHTTETPDWEQEVRRLTNGNGVDHVVEVLGGDQLRRSIAASAWGGHIAVVGFMNEQKANIPIPAILGSALRIQGITVGSQRHMRELLGYLEGHPIHPVIESTYDFADAPSAFDHLDRGPFGKVVIELRN
jgi:NADPH:quinone reductase-like Zn-dependent oxidoreductase